MRHDESGQAAILVLGVLLVCWLIVGVAVDGTRAFLYRRTLQSAADSAVLAAASELDRHSLYGRRGSVRLAAPAARTLVAGWLEERGLLAATQIEADAGRVSVVLRGGVRTSFLRLVGVEELPVAVEAVARPMP